MATVVPQIMLAGAAVEPRNISAKIPNPALLMLHYLAGETLIESYGKGVAMPGQGVFIGEPLAAPYRLAPVAATGGQGGACAS